MYLCIHWLFGLHASKCVHQMCCKNVIILYILIFSQMNYWSVLCVWKKHILLGGGGGGGERKKHEEDTLKKKIVIFSLWCALSNLPFLFFVFVKLAVTFHTELVSSKIPSLFVCAFIFVCLWFSGVLFFCCCQVSKCSSRLECLQLSGHDND